MRLYLTAILILLSTATFSQVKMSKVYYGSMSSSILPTEGQITGAAWSMEVKSGSDVVISYDKVFSDRYLWWAEPIEEPEKTKRYVSALDNDVIGPKGLFSLKGISGKFRVYVSNYPTSNTQYTQQFKIN